MRLWIGVTVLAAAFLGAPFLVAHASATPVAAPYRSDAHSDSDRVTDISACRRHRQYSYRTGYVRRSRAQIPYDGYRPWYPQPYSTRTYSLPYFGRGW